MKKLFLILALLSLAACSTQRFSVSSTTKRQTPSSVPHFTTTSHFFFWGIDQTDFRNAIDMCKDNGGPAFVEVKQSFAQGFFTAITYGIYSPRTMSLYCNKD